MTGIDSHEPNVKVCKILAMEHPKYRVDFFCEQIEEIIPLIATGEYDLVLGLSVLHYIAIEHGLEYAKNLLANLAEKVCAGIFELALKSETVFQHALPDNYRDLISGFDYIKLLAHNRWNSVDRPICFASKKYIYLKETGLMKIDRVDFHQHFHFNGIKYFYCGNKFVKYMCERSITFNRVIGAVDFLENMGGKNGLPNLLLYCYDKEDAFINYIIVMDKIDGFNLSEKISSYTIDERRDIVKQIFKWLICLERSGYYLFDLSTGNFIVNRDGKLIPVDYDYFLKKDDLSKFVDWSPFPRDYVMQATSIINELLGEKGYFYNKFSRSPQLNTTALKKIIPLKKYDQLLALTDSEDIFSRIYEILFESDDADEETAGYTLAERELLAIEEYLDRVGVALESHQKHFDIIEKKSDYLYHKTNELDEKFKKLVDYAGETQKEFSIANAKIEILAQENQKKDAIIKELAEITLKQQQQIDKLEKIIQSFVAAK